MDNYLSAEFHLSLVTILSYLPFLFINCFHNRVPVPGQVRFLREFEMSDLGNLTKVKSPSLKNWIPIMSRTRFQIQERTKVEKGISVVVLGVLCSVFYSMTLKVLHMLGFYSCDIDHGNICYPSSMCLWRVYSDVCNCAGLRWFSV